MHKQRNPIHAPLTAQLLIRCTRTRSTSPTRNDTFSRSTLVAKTMEGNGEMAEAVIKRLKAVTTTDVNSHSLGVEVSEQGDPNSKRNHIMIPRNSRLPFAYRQQFYTNVANPSGISIRLLEGEASDTSACTSIGDFRIVGLPTNLPVGTPVEVTYRYDARRRIHVSARELSGNKHASVEIVRDASSRSSSRRRSWR